MGRIAFIFTLLFSFQVQALDLLPPAIAAVLNQDLNSAQKTLGPAQNEEPQKLFYEIDGYRYRLILHHQDNQITQLRYVFTRSPYTLEDFLRRERFDPKNLSQTPSSGHHQNRLIQAVIEKDQQRWEVFFRPNSKKTLHSVIWKRLP